MRAFGSDRIHQITGHQWSLTCTRSKGWLPRVPKSFTRSEHPGTAVLWEDGFFEVVTAEVTATGGARYVLERWRDEHIIRVSEPYDEASEKRRETEHRTALGREKRRKTANLFGLLTGHLPAVVQNRLGSDLGILPTKLTALSLLLPVMYLIWAANEYVRRTMDASLGPMSPVLFFIAAYLFLETGIRLGIVWLQGRPIGSAAGFIVYLLYYEAGGKESGAISPFTVERGGKLFFTHPGDDIAMRDAFMLREPLLTLLAPSDQALLKKRFDYNYRTHAFIVAWVVLGFAMAGVISSIMNLKDTPTVSLFVSLAVAGVLAVEQAIRLVALRRGPAGSMLAVFVRPFARKLLR